MISVEGLKVEFNATPLFEDVSYVINKKRPHRPGGQEWCG